MSALNRPRALARKPSANPAWATLESLAIDYLALPPAPLPPAVEPQREWLRKQMLHRLMGTWVQMVADDVAPASSATDGAVAEVPAHRLQRRDSALEKIFRAEAKRLARRHGNEGLAEAYGGMTNLAANAQQDFVVLRLERFGKRQQTLLSGLLSQWDSERGSLYTFISRVAPSFLIDMARQHFGSAAPKPDQAGQAGHGANRRADHQADKLPRQRRARRGAAKMDCADAERTDNPARTQEATPPEWVMAEARAADAAADDGPGQPDGAAWLEAQMPEREDSPEALLQARQDVLAAGEMRHALHQAVQTLPDELRKLFEMELLKHDTELSDEEVAQRMGWGSRNTLIKYRRRLHLALRQHLGEGAAPAPA